MTELALDAGLLWNELTWLQKLTRTSKQKEPALVLCEAVNGMLNLATLGNNAVAWSAVPVKANSFQACLFAVEADLLLSIAADGEQLQLRVDDERVVVGPHQHLKRPNRLAAAADIQGRIGMRNIAGVSCEVTGPQLRRSLAPAARFTRRKQTLLQYDLRAVFADFANGYVYAASCNAYTTFESRSKSTEEPAITTAVPRYLIPVITSITPIGDDAVTITARDDLLKCECAPRGIAFVAAQTETLPVCKAFNSYNDCAVLTTDASEIRRALKRLCSTQLGRVRKIAAQATQPNTLLLSATSLDKNVCGEEELAAEVSCNVRFSLDSVLTLPFLKLVTGPVVIRVDDKANESPARIMITASDGKRFAQRSIVDTQNSSRVAVSGGAADSKLEGT